MVNEEKLLDGISSLLNSNHQFAKVVLNLFAKENSDKSSFIKSCKILKKFERDDELDEVFEFLTKNAEEVFKIERRKANGNSNSNKNLKKKRIVLDLMEDEDEKDEAPIVRKQNQQQESGIKFKKFKKTQALKLNGNRSKFEENENSLNIHENIVGTGIKEKEKEKEHKPSLSTIASTNSMSSKIFDADTNEVTSNTYTENPSDIEEERLWYMQDEIYDRNNLSSFYNDYDDYNYTPKNQFEKRKQHGNTQQNLRNRERNRENDLWIENQLRTSLGGGKLYDPTKDKDLIEEDDSLKFQISVQHLIPPFLDNANADIVLSRQKDPINVFREPDGELAFAAKNGSLMVRESRQKIEKEKQAKDAANIAGTMLGNVMGIKEEENDEEDEEEIDEENQKPSDDLHDEEINAVRKRLPIYEVKNELMQVINENQIIVIIGETGSGKTTQIPQYLYEAGYANRGKMIGVTQPRRVAAVSLAKRIADERKVKLGEEVGYSIRFENVTSDKTKIKFLSDGTLLRELMMDDNLDKYSAIIIDEAHERSLNTDLLLGLFKTILPRRLDLKLIITSATINADQFSNFFGNAPQYRIPGRTYPVEILHTAYPTKDYVDEAIRQALKIHINSVNKSGDILIFLTGKEDIDITCENLAQQISELPDVAPLSILPIYSTLPSDLQSKIFKKSKIRKCIVATNIAETSLTVDGVKYVIDSGFSKLNVFNPKLGMDTLQVCPVSVAQANQRSGRAGRTGPGVTFRLYTLTAQNEEMYPQPIPEIQRTNLSRTLLILKDLKINNLLEFPFIDPPPQDLISASLYELWSIGALDNFGNLTSLGSKMAIFPMEPSLSKSLILSSEYGCSEEIITVVSMLSVPQVFIRTKERQKENDLSREKFLVPGSDHLTLLNVYNQFLKNRCSELWCHKNFLHSKSLKRARDIRQQLLVIMRNLKLEIRSCGYNNDTLIMRCICSSFYQHTAKFKKFGEYLNLRNGLTMMLHPTSSLYGLGDLPKYIVYHELLLTSKEYMNCVTAVDPMWLLEFGQVFYKLQNTDTNVTGVVDDGNEELDVFTQKKLEFIKNLERDRVLYEKYEKDEREKKKIRRNNYNNNNNNNNGLVVKTGGFRNKRGF